MAGIGPPPKPTALKILQGNPGKQKLQNYPQVEAERPEPVDFFHPYAQKEFERIVPLLEKSGLISQIDRMVISAYCVACARWQVAEERVIGQEMVVKIAGNVQTNPLIKAARDEMDIMLKLAKEFGMTPASRSRITVDEKGIIRNNEIEKRFFAA